MKSHRYRCTILLLGFLLGIHEGKIALWKDNDPTPMRIFPYEVSQLSEAEQQALKKGIRADDLAQLKRMLKDRLS